MILLTGLVIIALAIFATIRRVDVRLVLFLAALALGVLAGLGDLTASVGQPHEQSLFLIFTTKPMIIVRTFLTTLVDEKFVVPICSAMGFAHVLRLTQCDRHLVQLLVKPLTRARVLLIPGTVIIGYLVNIPVISQTSTAVCIGAVLIPLLLAARISPITAGAALLLGASIGGELFNPGAPEIGTIVYFAKQTQADISNTDIVSRIAPLNLLHFGVTCTLFWIGSIGFEKRYHEEHKDDLRSEEVPADFRINYLKALIPVVPVVLLFLVGPPLELIKLDDSWREALAGKEMKNFSSRLVGAAMLAGAALAVLSTPSTARDAAKAFFDGAGYAFSSIIAVIVAATCFGKGIELIGLAEWIARMIHFLPGALLPTAGTLALSFAFLCGSGMATTQSLFRFFVEPAQQLNVDLGSVGAVVSLAAAAGRTMSPVATVTLMCATLTGTDPLSIVKRVWLPLLVSMTVVLTVATIMAAWH